jgi:hypothetical protein
VFTSIFTNTYIWAVANEAFTNGGNFNITGDVQRVTKADITSYYPSGETRPDIPSSYFKNRSVGDLYYAIDRKAYFLGTNDAEIESLISMFREMQSTSTAWERLEPKACLQAYFNIVTSTRRSVILVTNSTISNDNSVFNWGIAEEDGTSNDSNYWICSMRGQNGPGRACNPRAYLEKEAWIVHGHNVNYCLSEVKPAECKLQFSLNIMIVVIVFNTLKLSGMVFALLRFEASKLLATPGDAAISFLNHKDITTLNLGLASHRKVNGLWEIRKIGRPYHAAKRWMEAVSRARWVTFFTM